MLTHLIIVLCREIFAYFTRFKICQSEIALIFLKEIGSKRPQDVAGRYTKISGSAQAQHVHWRSRAYYVGCTEKREEKNVGRKFRLSRVGS